MEQPYLTVSLQAVVQSRIISTKPCAIRPQRPVNLPVHPCDIQDRERAIFMESPELHPARDGCSDHSWITAAGCVMRKGSCLSDLIRVIAPC